MFCSVLVDIGLMQDKLTLSTEQRNKVLQLWNAVEDISVGRLDWEMLFQCCPPSVSWCSPDCVQSMGLGDFGDGDD
ncbi:hypothetical protein F2P81_011954 [Scophthalmus maximus]|uniref:Uncharacterized protein n=1 Tax=Scophthalmus maximus TaxID=52904 RepID=A0A6A4T3A1_SCOMX|nr:hypothetical protein F2P81_011954 [Scophthalmus maximus]